MGTLPETTPAIFLMGATATGKTALSIELAKHLNAEIISVDSALVYRGMDIGTAKPLEHERSGIAHHLIDVVDPWESYSASQFCDDANALISAIHGRGKRVLLVGGTMLYYKALEEGLAKLPEANPQMRQALLQEAQSHGLLYLHEELKRVDPMAAARIHANDSQRLQRALEVYRLTGVALTDLQADTRSELAVAPIKFALVPSDRSWLHRRIEQRFQDMLARGFMSEMKRLYENPKLNSNCPAMRSVGYRQAWDYLDSLRAGRRGDEQCGVERSIHCAENDNIAYQWVDGAVAATRQLAKRQFTWLRSMSDVFSIECDTQSLQMQFDLIIKPIEARQR